MGKKIKKQDLHDGIKKMQNLYIKAYMEFAKSGDVAGFNEQTIGIPKQVIEGLDKQTANVLLNADKYFIFGWTILVNEMKKAE